MQAHAQANGYFVVFVFSLEHSSSPPRRGQWFPFARHLDQTGDFRVASAAVRLWLDRDKTRGRLWISLENSMSTLFSYTEFSPQQHRYGISTPRPSTSMPQSVLSTPRYSTRKTHTQRTPLSSPFSLHSAVPCFSRPTRERYQRPLPAGTDASPDQDPYQRGKREVGAGDDVRQTYCVPHPAIHPLLGARRGRPSDAARRRMLPRAPVPVTCVGG